MQPMDFDERREPAVLWEMGAASVQQRFTDLVQAQVQQLPHMLGEQAPRFAQMSVRVALPGGHQVQLTATLEVLE